MIKCRLLFKVTGEEDYLHDPKFGAQPQLINELLTMLSSYGIMRDGLTFIPAGATFDSEVDAFVITVVPYVPQEMTTPEPDIGEQNEDFFQPEEAPRAVPSPEEKRKLFKLIQNAREDNESE